jgi:hypothetical protein
MYIMHSHFAGVSAAFSYVECSALSQDNLSQVFDDAVCAVLDQKQRTKTKMMSLSSGRCSAM